MSRLNLSNNLQLSLIGINNNEFDSFRQNLPVYAYKDEILKTISQNRVTIISGETATGKSTQVYKIIKKNSKIFIKKFFNSEFLRFRNIFWIISIPMVVFVN